VRKEEEMYLPKHFQENRVEVLHDLIRSHPLATLITVANGAPNANHIPMHVIDSPAPFGTLRGHVARANPILGDWKEGCETLAIFHGPNSYITPSWYETRKETGKVVPTWNFVVVHAYGVVRVLDDPVPLREELGTLIDANEARFPEPWSLTDAPAEFTEKLMQHIVAFEMPVTRMIGKWKVSQNQPRKNQEGIVAGLAGSGQEGAEEMAAMVKRRLGEAKKD
jgi:transcriptional regulator